MPPATQNRKTNVVREFRRVVIKVPLCVGQLIDLVALYQFSGKAELADHIWRAGLVAYLGLEEEELDELVARPLPRGTAPPMEVHKLVDVLLDR